MSKKAFIRVIVCFVAAIAVTVLIFMTVPAMRPREVTATLIKKTGESGYEFWEFVERGAREGAREYGVSLTVIGPQNEADIEGQIALVDEAIAEDPDVIILAPSDQEELRAAAQRIADANTHLILLDSQIAREGIDGIEDCFVGISNQQVGRELAARMAEKLPHGGQVAVVQAVAGASTAKDRLAGIEEGLALHPNIDLVETVSCEDSEEIAYQQTKDLIERYPKLRGIFGTNPRCTAGAARALRERKGPHIYFFAVDTSVTQNENLETGIVDGFIVQLAFNLGYLGVEAGYETCRGLLRTGRIDSGYVYVTKENMREENIQKLIYPF